MKVFDAHCDTVLRMVDEAVDIRVPSIGGHIDIPRLLSAGVGCQVFACFASRDEHGPMVRERSLNLLSAVKSLADDPRVVFPRSAAELASVVTADDRLAIIITVEGGDMLRGDISLLPWLKEQGIRSMTIAWGDNELVGGAFGTAYGLTEIGRAAVREMSRLKMLIDVSHTSDAGFDDIFAATDATIIASHSNTRPVCPTPRNLTDDQVRRIAERGGVIGVTFVSGFLTPEAAECQAPFMRAAVQKAQQAGGGLHEYMEEAYAEIAKSPKPPFEAFIAHIDRLVEVGGIDCVAFGSDFDGFRIGAEGLESSAAWPLVIAALRRHGYGEAELRKICWDNWVRVFSTTF